MENLIDAWSALPNLHPVVVHFPIAWLPLTIVVESMALLLSRHRPTLIKWATVAWVLSALATGGAYWAGRVAAQGLTGLAPDLQAAVNIHADWAWRTLWAVGTVAAARLVVRFRPRWWDRTWVGAVFLALGLGCLGLIAKTADLGGGLVYERGIAVAPAEAARRSEAEARSARAQALRAAADAHQRLMRRKDGFIWRPNPRDAVLGTLVTAAPGSDLTAVSVLPAASGAEGLHLQVDGAAFILFPGEPGDVQLEATLGVTGFRGTLALVHHFLSATDYEELTVELPVGTFSLRHRGRLRTETHDRATTTLSDSPLRLGVSAISRHLRGTVGEELVVHGHRAAVSGGRVGLRLDGRGTLRIHSVRAQSADEAAD